MLPTQDNYFGRSFRLAVLVSGHALVHPRGIRPHVSQYKVAVWKHLLAKS